MHHDWSLNISKKPVVQLAHGSRVEKPVSNELGPNDRHLCNMCGEQLIIYAPPHQWAMDEN
jgi:hypothetical protein